MRRRVEHNGRPVGVNHVLDARTVPHGADDNFEVQGVAVAHFHLILQVVGVVLINIEHDDAFRVEARDLPAELAADGTAAARDENGLIL